MIVEPLHPQDVEAARSLYLEAFPEYERADWDSLVSHSGWGDAELLGLYDGGLVGISYVIFDETVLFVLYLAVEARATNLAYNEAAAEGGRAGIERPIKRAGLNWVGTALAIADAVALTGVAAWAHRALARRRVRRAPAGGESGALPGTPEK